MGLQFYQPCKKMPPQQLKLQPPSTLAHSFPVYQSWKKWIHNSSTCPRVFFLTCRVRSRPQFSSIPRGNFVAKKVLSILYIRSVCQHLTPVYAHQIYDPDIPVCVHNVFPFIVLCWLEFCGETFQCTRYVYKITKCETNWHSLFHFFQEVDFYLKILMKPCGISRMRTFI